MKGFISKIHLDCKSSLDIKREKKGNVRKYLMADVVQILLNSQVHESIVE